MALVPVVSVLETEGVERELTVDMVKTPKNAKLTWAKVREARRLWADTDITQKRLCEMFGLKKSAMSQLLRRLTWRETA